MPNMANSKTDICNLSLDLLGAIKINSIDTPESEKERLLSRWYDLTRLNLLRMHDWNFAVKRALLPRVITLPVFGDQIPYELPSDYVMFVSAGSNLECVKSHIVEGETLYVKSGFNYEQDGSLPLRYVSDFEVVSKFSPLFTTALVQLLAANICYQESNSRTSVETLKSEFLGTMKLAANQDAKESPVRLVNNFRNYLEKQ